MKTDEAYSILDIINEDYGVILTKGGNICMSFLTDATSTSRTFI